MSDSNTDAAPVADSWDSYWQSARSEPAYAGDGASQPQLVSFWTTCFNEYRAHRRNPRLLDIASGNGAVIDVACSVFIEAEITCLDLSRSALQALKQRYPLAETLVADAQSVPLADASFDLITSQFGIEYGGDAAIAEACRLTATGGELALLLHNHGGQVFEQCQQSHDAVSRLQSAGFVARSRDMFSTGFAMLQGGDTQAYESAGRALAPAIETVEKIIADFGEAVANGTLIRLYRDIRNIHGRMQHHDADDVIGWLDQMQRELEAYRGRMEHMLSVALDEEAFNRLRQRLVEQGFTERRARPLQSPAEGRPLAWELVVRKHA